MSRTTPNETGGFGFRSVIFGLVGALVCTATLAFVYALSVAMKPSLEGFAAIGARAVVMVSAFIGGMFAGRRSNRVGWLHGAAVGVMYILVMLAFGRASSPMAATGAVLFQRLIVTALVAAIGGIAGVNF